MGFTGGVSVEPITKDMIRIVSRGNAYTDKKTVQDYTLLKAAETTKEMGYSHFGIMGGADASSSHTFQSSPGQIMAVPGGALYSAPSYSNVVKPGTDTIIKMFSIKDKTPVPDGVFLADEIIQTVGARVKRPS